MAQIDRNVSSQLSEVELVITFTNGRNCMPCYIPIKYIVLRFQFVQRSSRGKWFKCSLCTEFCTVLIEMSWANGVVWMLITVTSDDIILRVLSISFSLSATWVSNGAASGASGNACVLGNTLRFFAKFHTQICGVNLRHSWQHWSLCLFFSMLRLSQANALKCFRNPSLSLFVSECLKLNYIFCGQWYSCCIVKHSK